ASVLSFKGRLKSAQGALDGFPWKLATALYTLSWGWSLLRPNTLYWDDWAYIYNKPKSYLNEIFVNTGLPPWRALIDQELIAVGYWTIPVLTFLFFFASGIALYLILKKVIFLNQTQINFTILIFLIAPVNHARIALVMFGYTTSFFLFFVAWAILVRHKKAAGYLLAVILFFWSFMTHSFLFFYVVPFAHFALTIAKKSNFKNLLRGFKAKLLVLALLPILYYLLRGIFWSPSAEFKDYHRVTLDGAIRGILFFAICGFISFAGLQISQFRNSTNIRWAMVIASFSIFAWGLFPYFVNQSLGDFVSVFAFRADYGTRHLLLTPLGIGLIVTSIATMIRRPLQKKLIATFLGLFMLVNIFFGTQYLLDSYKKDQLTELFRQTEVVNSSSDLIFVDDTKLFNGRFSTYRNTELIGLVSLADKSVKSISGKSTCDDVEIGYEIRLKSDKSFSSALLSRKLGLYFEIKEC
ncbi:MAG: hypothetical protein O2996_02190, partial [Actinomycetota bacterium]|nr:hypothetical protein [Actinomycetota bacterium]